MSPLVCRVHPIPSDRVVFIIFSPHFAVPLTDWFLLSRWEIKKLEERFKKFVWQCFFSKRIPGCRSASHPCAQAGSWSHNKPLSLLKRVGRALCPDCRRTRQRGGRVGRTRAQCVLWGVAQVQARRKLTSEGDEKSARCSTGSQTVRHDQKNTIKPEQQKKNNHKIAIVECWIWEGRRWRRRKRVELSN